MLELLDKGESRSDHKVLNTRGVKTSHSGLVGTMLAQNARESVSTSGGGRV